MQSSITETIKSTNFQDLISDISETTIDAFLDEGLVKDIPVFGFIFKSRNLVSTIQDKLFSKKLLKFLKQLTDTTPEERVQQIEKIEKNKDYKIKIGEKILYIIDKCEDYEKSEIVGILFKNFIKNNIEYNSFLRYVNSINSLSTTDLKEFIIKESFIETFISMNSSIYLNTGLIEFRLNSNLKRTDRAINTPDIEVIYTPSKLGKELKSMLKEYYT